MTLAVILVNVSFILSSVAAQDQASPPSAQTSQPDTTATQDQGNAKRQSPPAASQPAPAESKPGPSPSPTKNRKGLPPRVKRRVLPAKCDPGSASPETKGSASSAETPADTKALADPAASAKPTAPAAAPAPTNCPPSKVIVQQGSTSEPTIQLVGGDGTSHQGDAAHMLTATDANLKKIEGTPLTSSQQDIVTQVHQFMDQSKKATAAGDTEQARTLAWKAKTLSDELIAPTK